MAEQNPDLRKEQTIAWIMSYLKHEYCNYLKALKKDDEEAFLYIAGPLESIVQKIEKHNGCIFEKADSDTLEELRLSKDWTHKNPRNRPHMIDWYHVTQKHLQEEFGEHPIETKKRLKREREEDHCAKLEAAEQKKKNIANRELADKQFQDKFLSFFRVNYLEKNKDVNISRGQLMTDLEEHFGRSLSSYDFTAMMKHFGWNYKKSHGVNKYKISLENLALVCA
jgi:hypothetical protein